MVSQNKNSTKEEIFCWLTISNFLYIIVLLILAGVTIATLTGDNGILNRATEAKEKTQEAQRKEETDLDYMDKYIDKVVNNKSLVLNKGTVYPIDQNQFDTFDEFGNFQDVGKAEYSTDYTMNANKSIKITRYSTDSTQTKYPAIGIPMQLDLSNVDNIGIWIYNPYFEGVKTNANFYIVFTSQSWVGTYNENDSIKCNISGYEFSQGWNFFNINISEFTTTGNVDLSNIQNIIFRMGVEDKTLESVLYLDSIVLDYKIQPTVLLNFDSLYANLYDTIYPLFNDYGFVETAFATHNEGFGINNWITKEQYDEMKKNGWDFGMYGGDGTVSNSIFSENDNYDEQYKSLKAHRDELLNMGFTDLISYSCPNNSTSTTNIQVLNDLGFKIMRAKGNKYTYPIKELTQGDMLGIQDDNLETIKSEIDRCIKTGYCLSIFTHGIYENNTNSLYTDKAIYTEMLDYIKQKVDAGELQVMSYKDFYEACSME